MGIAKAMWPTEDGAAGEGQMYHTEVKAEKKKELLMTTGSKLKTVMEKSKYNY